MLRRTFLAGAAVIALMGPALADAISEANEAVAKYAQKVEAWDGPTTGPKAAEGKTIVVLAADMKNGGVLGVTTGVEEAAAKIGWTVRVLDGAGSIQGRTAAFGQALALKPDGIIINGFDAVEQQAALAEVRAAKIPIVSWHAGPVIGPDEKNGIFTNVSTDAMQVSEVAAKWAFADAGGKPGVVIFTDSTYAIAIAKADKIKETIEKLGGTVLEYVDTPIADTSNRMPTLTTALLQKYGAKWTHSLAINDIYFDFMGPSLAAAASRRRRAEVGGRRRRIRERLPAHPLQELPGGHRRRTAEPARLAARRRTQPRRPERAALGLRAPAARRQPWTTSPSTAATRTPSTPATATVRHTPRSGASEIRDGRKDAGLAGACIVSSNRAGAERAGFFLADDTEVSRIARKAAGASATPERGRRRRNRWSTN